MVKREASLVAQLFADLEEYFRHENQVSRALSDQGKLRLGKESDILAYVCQIVNLYQNNIKIKCVDKISKASPAVFGLSYNVTATRRVLR